MPGEPVAPPSDGEFAVGRHGYDPQQVDAHLRRLDAEIRILVADRDAAVDQAAQLGRDLEESRLRTDRLRTQVRTMAARPSDVQGMSERMRTMLRLAEDEVADMLRRADEEVARRLADADRTAEQLTGAARREAAEIRSLARAEGEAILAEAARHGEETDAACAANRRSLAEERAAAEHAIALATDRAELDRGAAWAESERRRATVEEDFSIAMDQRRAEALSAIQRERAQVAHWVQHTRDEAARQVRAEIAAAEETARRMITEARDRVAELADLRGRIAAQLRGTQAQLGTALDDLAPDALPAPPPAPAVEPAPQVRALAPAPDAPALPPASGSDKQAHDPAQDEAQGEADPAQAESEPTQAEAEPVTQPFPAVSARTLVLDAAGDADRETTPDTELPGPGDRAQDVPGPRPSDDSPPDDSPPDEPEGASDRPERVAAEARRPTQRRRKRQSSGTRR